MAHITKQERVGLEELFICIKENRYKSRWYSHKRSIQLLKNFSKHYGKTIYKLTLRTKHKLEWYKLL